MLKNFIRGIFSIIGLVVGYLAANFLEDIINYKGAKYLAKPVYTIIFYLVFIIVFGIIFYFISAFIYKAIASAIESFEKNTQKLTTSEFIFGVVGMIIGLIIATFAGIPIAKIHPIIGPILYIFIDIVAATIGIKLFMKRKDDIISLGMSLKKSSTREKKHKGNGESIPKVLDTSVIIDGRIFDICETGFIEGPLVIPNFVLDELRHISDSADGLKRNRGRRGLDVLNKIQKELKIETQIWEGDFPEIAEVDSKLLKLAQVLGGKVITNDYNLNKVAEFQGVPVLNINELANSVKPVVIPGEEMKVVVMKDGKEPTQGVAYLDDGTMIVVEGGKRFMGQEIYVIVTSVLQTAAGRMIFAKPKES